MYLGKNNNELNQLKAFHTAKEICQQGDVWRKLTDILSDLDEKTLSQLQNIAQNNNAKIILTGAGTSAYIGNILALALDNICNASINSIPTTDIVSQPGKYVDQNSQGIMFSFGRSGNSPESIDAVEKIEQIAPNMHHVYITCNKDGALAKRAVDNAKATLCLMPAETHDVSFVMTSSFSSMLLFTYGLFQKAIFGNIDFDYAALAQQSDNIAQDFYQNALFENLHNIDRIVYLGSNNLFGAAQESALKAIEMTQGKVVTMAETSLGFRHGPKSIINNKTMICVFVSSDPYTQLFDKDIINELIADDDAAQIVIFASASFFQKYSFTGDKVLQIPFEEQLNKYNDALLAPLFVNFAQVIGFNMSINLGFSPDNPCPGGQVNRVVKGVTLYEYPYK